MVYGKAFSRGSIGVVSLLWVLYDRYYDAALLLRGRTDKLILLSGRLVLSAASHSTHKGTLISSIVLTVYVI